MPFFLEVAGLQLRSQAPVVREGFGFGLHLLFQPGLGSVPEHATSSFAFPHYHVSPLSWLHVLALLSTWLTPSETRRFFSVSIALSWVSLLSYHTTLLYTLSIFLLFRVPHLFVLVFVLTSLKDDEKECQVLGSLRFFSCLPANTLTCRLAEDRRFLGQRWRFTELATWTCL